MSGYLNEQVVAVIREAMERGHVSQTELAGRCGVSVPAITRALSGRQNLTLDTVQRYLDDLGLVGVLEVTPATASSDVFS